MLSPPFPKRFRQASRLSDPLELGHPSTAARPLPNPTQTHPTPALHMPRGGSTFTP